MGDVNTFGVKYAIFTCKQHGPRILERAAQEARVKTVDAFKLPVAKGCSYPSLVNTKQRNPVS